MFGISEKIYNFVLTIKNKLMRKPTKKKQDPAYMLFVFGDFTDLEIFTQELSMQFLPLVSSHYLKFTYGEYGAVFHFRSNETFSDLKQYVEMILEGITSQYFLMEKTKNAEIVMDKKLKKDFLGIDGKNKTDENKTGTINVDDFKDERIKNIKNVTLEFMMPIMDPESLFNIDTTYQVVEPTVDEILEKITEKGIESLTEREKQILDNYGKREK